MSVSESVKDAIHAGLFDIFSNNLEISTTTGYDWTQASENTKSEQTTVKIEAEAPPGSFFIMQNIYLLFIILYLGTILVIEQAVGHCDGNEAKTEMFRTSHQDSKGNVLFQSTGKAKDGVIKPL